MKSISIIALIFLSIFLISDGNSTQIKKKFIEDGAFASPKLENLVSPTTVNQDLIPLSSVRNLGNSTTPWNRLFTGDVLLRDGGVSYGILDSGASLSVPSGATVQFVLVTGAFAPDQNIGINTINSSSISFPSGSIYQETGNQTSASVGTANSGSLRWKTGNVTNANNSGASGSMIWETGTAATGARGIFEFKAPFMRIPLGTADPTAPAPTGGEMYYNTSTGKFRGYNAVAVAWQDLN